MNEPPHPDHAPARGRGTRSGAFRLDLEDDRWWWSDEVYGIYGFAPHEVVPTSALVDAHEHPADREGVRDALVEAGRSGQPFSTVHRIVAARGDERLLATVGQRASTSGTSARLDGFVLDLTDEVAARAREDATRSITASARTRGTIEQALGAVALSEGVDAEQAFALLRQASNDRNVPIRRLADLIVRTLPSLHDDPARLSAVLHGLLSSSHRLARAVTT